MDADEQRKYAKLRGIDADARRIQESLAMIDKEEAELARLIESIDDLGDSGKDEEILVPFANGVFLRAKVADPKRLLVNVGAGTLVPKTHDEVKELLKNQLESIAEYKRSLMAALEELYRGAEEIERGIARPDEVVRG